jgi:pilus assembly protein CpaC
MKGLRAFLTGLALAVGVATVASPASAQGAPAPTLHIDREISSSKEISLEVGQNRLMEANAGLGRVAVANPEVADLKVVTNTQLLLTAKGVGDTYLTLWDKQDVPLVMSLHVTRNLDALRKQLKELFPDEKINVSVAGDLVVLSGDVSDVRVPERVLAVGRLHASKIANQLRVPGNQQVQLEVKFAEVSRTALREVGLNVFHNNGNRVAGVTTPYQPVGGFADRLPNLVPGTNGPGVPSVYPGAQAGAFNLFFSGLSSFPFSAVLSLLEENQLAKTLAEPTLVSMTGQEAHFLAGGEFPIPVSSGLGTVQVLFKKFGIQLTFTPTVLSEGLINLQLQSEVSEIDPSLSVQLGGFTIPGLTTRQSDSTVRLRDGQSFAIAGLLSDKTRANIDKVPGLGDIPILGALFRSSSYRRDETELLVVITARLVHPVGPKDAPVLPGGDELNDPDDFELFLLGKMGTGPSHPPTRNEAISVPGHHSGGPAGEVGYMR